MSAEMNVVDLQREIVTSTPPSYVGSLSGSNDVLSVSSTGTSTVTGLMNYIQWFQPVSAGAGSGPYTRKIVIDRTTNIPKRGATFQINLSIVASNNPTIEIYDGSVGGTKMQTIQGDSSNATEFLFEAEYNGSNYVKSAGEYVL